MGQASGTILKGSGYGVLSYTFYEDGNVKDANVQNIFAKPHVLDIPNLNNASLFLTPTMLTCTPLISPMVTPFQGKLC